ncbi:MAG: UDP-N-acetylmuramoyl-tripeptide--D-alanyl-D-alanine ligase [Saprospiraceae bacterium]|nr:UDP-N-acetylmuramoyl-tripeptide--D-alanyl-D-alanine ligase [Saprospiraceae bacterium]
MISTPQMYQYYRAHPYVYTDTRKAREGGIFFAIGRKNEQGIHRGNNFAVQAIEQLGAAYAVVNDPQLLEHSQFGEQMLLVEDCEVALQELSKEHRQQLKIPIIAIAGSNGKTTTKELLQLALSEKYEVFATHGNFNNHLGVPLSLLQINAKHEIAILELGANHLGETAFLANIVQADFGLITNCGKDHLGEYGSVANIIKANGELFDILATSNGHAFANANDPIILKLSEKLNQRSFFGKGQQVNAYIMRRPFLEIDLHIGEDAIVVQTQLFGAFWLDTLISVAHIANYFGISIQGIQKAFEAYQPASLRSQQTMWNRHDVLLVCYNANPSSMEVFVAEIQEGVAGAKFLVLGEMLELGDYSQTEHQALLEQIQYDAFEKVILVGNSFDQIQLPNQANLEHFDTAQNAKIYLESLHNLDPKISFFVKGSRGNKLESIFSIFI